MILLEYLAHQPTVFLVVVAGLGLLVGSFLNVVIYRLPVMMQREWAAECREFLELPADETAEEPLGLVTPRSRCPSCSRMVRAWENVPVFSYLALRGKCAGCGWRIPLRYPLVELLTGTLSLLAAWHFGYGLQALGALLLIWALIALCFIDFDHQLLPDSITQPLLWLGLGFNFFGVFVPLEDAVAGAVFGYGILWLVFQAFKLVTGKEGMGFGDFKLLALLGAWQGWQMLPAIILISSVVGAIIGIGLIVLRRHGRDTPIPFGPYLVLGGLITLWAGEPLNRLYLGL